jgi:hypothetical protein
VGQWQLFIIAPAVVSIEDEAEHLGLGCTLAGRYDNEIARTKASPLRTRPATRRDGLTRHYPRRSTCVSEEDELDERLPLRRIDDTYDAGKNRLVLQQQGTISIHDLRSAGAQPLS